MRVLSDTAPHPLPEWTGEDVVVTHRLTRRYGSRAVVDDVSLRIRRGEAFGLLGPNGAGKTTTLRMLVGLVRPTSGSASVFGEPAGASLVNIGALIEGPGFYPYLSGRTNLRVMAKYGGAPAARVDAVLQTVDLMDRSDDRYGKYSLGMKQRLGVAAALLKDPELVILDEPTNGLDPAGMADMRGLLRRLVDNGHTVVLSSHLLAEVEQVCDRVAVLSRGRLVADNTVDELRGLGRLVVAADPLPAAADVVARMLGAERVSVVDGVLHLQVRSDDAASINRALVGARIDVTELRQEARTLEEAFLEMTGSEVPDPVTQPGASRIRRLARRAGDR